MERGKMHYFKSIATILILLFLILPVVAQPNPANDVNSITPVPTVGPTATPKTYSSITANNPLPIPTIIQSNNSNVVYGSINKTSNITNTTIDTDPLYPLYPRYRLERQGADVYVNDTVDISGMGWGTGLAWYGRYGETEIPAYVYEFKSYRYGLMNFWLDPEVFASRPGRWFQFYGNNTLEVEGNGNLIMFNVLPGYKKDYIKRGNDTANTTIIKPIVLESLLPEVRVSDYVLAKGDPLTIRTPNNSRVWIFSNNQLDKLYNVSTQTNKLVISSEQLKGFEAGSYTILIDTPGENTIYEAAYNSKTDSIVSPWAVVNPISVKDKLPSASLSDLKRMLDDTDDVYYLYKLEIQEPSVTIKQMDEKAIGERAYEFRLTPGLVTIFDIRGYTNLADGTNISVTLDKNNKSIKEERKRTVYAVVNKTSPGNMSAYKAMMPIIWDEMSIGMHTITVTGKYGESMNVDFPVSIMPADSYKPNATLKYAGDRNPWIAPLPTPAPIIINTESTKEVIKEVYKEVPPSNETLYEIQAKAYNDVVSGWVFIIGGIIIGLIVLFFVGRYSLSVVRRLND